MAEFDDEQFEQEQGESQDKGGKGLRKQLEAALATVQQLKEENQTLSSRVRGRELNDLLSSKGVKGGIAKFYPKDAEVSEEAVNSWITENADVFGIQVGEQEDEQPNDEHAGSRQRIQKVANTAASGSSDLSALNERIASATTQEELNAVMREVGQALGTVQF